MHFCGEMKRRREHLTEQAKPRGDVRLCAYEVSEVGDSLGVLNVTIEDGVEVAFLEARRESLNGREKGFAYD